MKLKITSGIIVVSLIISACNETTNSSLSNSFQAFEEAKKAIAESNVTYWQAFSKNDSTLFIDRYSQDACIMLPNAPAMCGENAAPQFFKAAYHQMGIRNGKFITTEVFPGNENYVIECGLFELRDRTDKFIDNGKYLVLWKKQEKGWKMFRDCFSSNNPISM